MTAKSDVTTFDSMMRGLYPRTPDEMPDWARKAWAERAELERTGKRVKVEPHEDNTGMPCREVGPASLVYDLGNHDCCHICNTLSDLIAAMDRLRTEAGSLREVRVSTHEPADEFRRLAEALRSHLRDVPVFGATQVPRGDLWITLGDGGVRVLRRDADEWAWTEAP